MSAVQIQSNPCSHEVNLVNCQLSEVTFPITVLLCPCCVQAGINPSFSSEIPQKILMEEGNAQKEEPQENAASDVQHLGENSLGMHLILRDFQ